MTDISWPILIALGANLPSSYGDPAQTLKKAVEAISSENITVLKRSSIWLTSPVPVSDQPWYHNGVIAVDTQLAPSELLQKLLEIENAFGRVRSQRNAPRLIDLDVLSYGNTVFNSDTLTLPHPRMMERGFVLYPLLEVAPDWQHPVTGQKASESLKLLPDDQRAEKSVQGL